MKQGVVTQITKGRTPYHALYAIVEGEIVPLQATQSELKTLTARGLKQEDLMPELEPIITGRQNAPHGSINIIDLGCRADFNPAVGAHEWTDNARLIQEYCDTLPTYTRPRFWIPPIGDQGFWFSTSLVARQRKGLDIIGGDGLPYEHANGITAKLFFGTFFTPCTGIIYETLALASTLKGFAMFANAQMLLDRPMAGIYHRNILRVEDVYVEKFVQGFFSQGSMPANASMSVYTDCRATHCIGDGFVAQGDDANRIRYIGIVAQDNGGFGFKDQSLLGCTYFGPQTEANKKGGWAITSATAETKIYSNYDEGGQPANYITPDNGLAYVDQANNPNGYTGSLAGQPQRKHGGYVRIGKSSNEENVGLLRASQANLGGLDIKQAQEYGEGIKLELSAGPVPFLTFAQAGVPTEVMGTPVNHLPTGKRAFKEQVTIFNGAYIRNGFLHTPGTSDHVEGQVFKLGDYIDNTVFSDIEYWRCIVPGRIGASKKTFKPLAPIGNYGGDQSRQLFELPAEDYKELMDGDILSFPDGAKARVFSVDTEHLIKITNPPDVAIHDGDRIDWAGMLNEYMQPVGYTEDAMILPFQVDTKAKDYKVGDVEIINGAKSTVLEVSEEFGVRRVRFSLPEGGDKSWYSKGNQIGFGKDNVTRIPAEYADDQLSIVMAFPLSHIQQGAKVQVNKYSTSTVLKVITPGVSVEAIEGRIYGQTSFTIQKAKFKAY